MNARDYALLELDARHLPGWKTGALSRRNLDASAPSDPRDLALAERIVIGVVKNHTLLMHLIRHYSGKSLNQIDPLVQKVLAIALYQLRFLDRVPASAAVDEAVEQCRRFSRARAAGFVNAVLRNATRDPEPSLPDPHHDPEAYASIVLSHPPGLFRRLTQVMSVEDALQICRHNNDEPPTIVRLFRGVPVKQLAREGVTITPHEQPGMFVVAPAKRALLESWARRGVAQAQDPTAAQAVQLLDIHPGQRVLDRCAGLGTKTLQMREHLGESGSILAVDPSAPRCEGLRQLLEARGIENIRVHQVPMLRQIESVSLGTFDRILVDVPCSNSGVLARRPEARYAQDRKSLESLEKLQRDILDDTAPYLASNGIMIYSTCSVWPEENEQQVEQFLDRHPYCTLQTGRSILPSLDSRPENYHDGGFIAVLRRA